MTTMPLTLTDEQRSLKAGVAEIAKRYPGEYWRELDRERAYPEAFVAELTRAGYLAALIPPEYGGAGLGIYEAGLILETINACGANAGACHAQMYIMGTLLRHGSPDQKRVLPQFLSIEEVDLPRIKLLLVETVLNDLQPRVDEAICCVDQSKPSLLIERGVVREPQHDRPWVRIWN